MLNDLKTGLIYRNPAPHLKSIHAYFPSVVVLPEGEMIATMVLGEAFEALNLRTCLARSVNNGESWSLEGPLCRGNESRLTSDFARISLLPGGEPIILMARMDRTGCPGEGLSNPETSGFAPTGFLLFRTNDSGRTWSGPAAIVSPLGDVPLELCSPVIPLRDGRCVIPTSPWKTWDGGDSGVSGMITLISHDRCETWPEYGEVMTDPAGELRFWESKIIELKDGRLCAVAWVYNEALGHDLPNHYTLSGDGGKSWSKPESTGLFGQTLTPFLLDDGRILCVYRRMDKPGLWANISRIVGDRWVNDHCEPLWGHGVSGLTVANENMMHNFQVLRFGAPCITRLPDGKLFIAFWAYEDYVSNIRWFSFTIN